MKIITNHHYRPILHWSDLTEEEQNLRYGMYDDIEGAYFFKYKDCLYDLNDFLRVNEQWGKGILKDWDGCHNESFFSSVLVKYDDSFESVKVGLALS